MITITKADRPVEPVLLCPPFVLIFHRFAIASESKLGRTHDAIAIQADPEPLRAEDLAEDLLGLRSMVSTNNKSFSLLV